MHGVKRDRSLQTAEARQARKDKEAAKLQAYLGVQSSFFAYKSRNEKSQEALEATTRILTQSPELYTAWNYRREVLEALFSGSKEGGDGADSRNDGLEEKKDFFASLRVQAEDGPGEASSSTTPATTAEVDEKDEIEKRRKQRSLNRMRELLEDDLQLTTHALRAHPKVYWIWNHRKWCLQEYPDETGAKWKHELTTVDKMLEMDPRNFHGWTHRRYIFSHLAGNPVTIEASRETTYPYSLAYPDLNGEDKKRQLQLARQELAFSLSKIEANFSNFSAWHRRSILLPLVWEAESLSETQMRNRRDEEFDLVKQALFTDPDDQSVWIYHEWLVDKEPSQDVLEREIDVVRELIDLEPDSKLCMRALSHYISLLSKIVERTDSARATSLSTEARDLLQRLVDVDPDRKGRYLDLLQDLPDQ